MLRHQRDTAPKSQDQFGEVVLELNPEGWMEIHQEMGRDMIILGISFSIWKENITL